MAKADTIRSLARRRQFGPARRLAEDETLEVRFLHELDDGEWACLGSRWDPDSKRTVFRELDESDQLEEGEREAFFASVYVPASKDTHVLELRKTMMDDLLNYEAEYGSLCDRLYKLRRAGRGLDTTYSAIPMDKEPMKKKELAAADEMSGAVAGAADSLIHG